MRLSRRGSATTPDLDLRRGERLLAFAERSDGAGPVGGSRDALYLPHRVPWEAVATADWDSEEELLRVVELAPYGQAQPTHSVPLRGADGAGRLLQLVRERVTASVVLRREVPVRKGAGLRVIGRRAPGRPGPVAWFVEYDEALDPTDPQVAAVADAALALARSDVGE